MLYFLITPLLKGRFSKGVFFANKWRKRTNYAEKRGGDESSKPLGHNLYKQELL